MKLGDSRIPYGPIDAPMLEHVLGNVVLWMRFAALDTLSTFAIQYLRGTNMTIFRQQFKQFDNTVLR